MICLTKVFVQEVISRIEKMKKEPILIVILFLLVAGVIFILPSSAEAATPIKAVGATASSVNEKYSPDKAIDGVINDASRWVSAPSETPAWLDLNLGVTGKVSGIHLYSGYGAGDPIESFAVQFWRNGQWVEIPSAVVTGNKATALALPFDAAVDVTTDRLRLWVTRTPNNMARVKEVVVWPGPDAMPPLPVKTAGPLPQDAIVPIYLNQSGFNLGKPKRFTAPTLAEGTPFVVRTVSGGKALFSGQTIGHIGDFSEFNSTDDREYVVEAGGLRSVPFRVGLWWLERVSYQGAIDFMVDSRHYVGNYKGGCGGSYGWRDDHHFGWELHALVPQYLSNPSAYDSMPRQIEYVPGDGRRWGKLEAYKPETPDLVKLIHWGADVIVTQGLTHEHLKAQLAYFLYAWPVLESFLPAQNYEVVKEFAFRTWAMPNKDRNYPYDESPENNLLALKTRLGTTKGAYPPGFSVEPNLLMYEVAKREKRSDAEVYFKAAYEQAAWMIVNLDWEDPLVTKGQRMSEFLTMTGLAHFQREYPDRAPAGLREKIAAWVQVAVRRSANLWDFRKLGDGDDQWTPVGPKPQMWNETGNVVGLPAALLAAGELVDDPVLKARVEQIAFAHFDNMFGRNPVGRHFSFDASREVEGVEHGWFIQHAGGIGQLSDARFVLDGSPKNAHYPYHPEKGNSGWTEGWIQHNTPFNLSLAYLARANTRLEMTQESKALVVRLSAPLNFDHEKDEPVTLKIAGPNGLSEVLLNEEVPRSAFHIGRIALDKLGAKPGDVLKCRYGFGYMATGTELKIR